jgi:hypothetical protein
VNKISEISLSPIGKEEIHKLEYALLVGTLFRPEVIEEVLRNPEERLTWVDSLAVAAAALARERAKLTVSQIAEELGRTEAAIRSHLAAKTKAGQLVRETYDRFVKEGIKLDFGVSIEKYEKEKKERERLEKEVNVLKEKLANVRGTLGKVKEDVEKLVKELTKI